MQEYCSTQIYELNSREYVWVHVPFRGVPVPGVRKYNRRKGGGWKHPATTNELRQNECAIADGDEQYVRKARCKKLLVNAWWDMPRTDRDNRNWKRCTKRKHQYKD